MVTLVQRSTGFNVNDGCVSLFPFRLSSGDWCSFQLFSQVVATKPERPATDRLQSTIQQVRTSVRVNMSSTRRKASKDTAVNPLLDKGLELLTNYRKLQGGEQHNAVSTCRVLLKPVSIFDMEWIKTIPQRQSLKRGSSIGSKWKPEATMLSLQPLKVLVCDDNLGTSLYSAGQLSAHLCLTFDCTSFSQSESVSLYFQHHQSLC